MVVVGSIFERRAAGVYHNTAVVLDADGSLRGRYRKMHIPDDPLYYEKYYFTPGDLGFQAFDTRVRPRRHARLLGPVVSRGRAADRPAGGRDPLLSDGDRLAPGREGRVRRRPGRAPGRPSSGRTPSPTACTSRPSTGSATKGPPGGGLEFWGGSFLADPFGRVLARAGRDSRGGPDRHLRPAPPGRDPPQLAVPPRPPHRRLRADHPAVPRLEP